MVEGDWKIIWSQAISNLFMVIVYAFLEKKYRRTSIVSKISIYVCVSKTV